MTETAVPTLLNEELVLRCLQKYHSIEYTVSDLKLKSCNFKRCSASGENYCSDIYQADVEYELNGIHNSKSFFIKIMIPEIAEAGSNEQIMFSKILPAMENILNATEMVNNKLHARCLVHERREKEEFYVLENLNSMGYYCADRTEGLDLQQSLVLMKKIAKFHAAAMLYIKNLPDILEHMFKGSDFEKGACDSITKSIIYGGLEHVANMIANWPSFEGLADKLTSLIPKYNDAYADIIDITKSKFNVITHGDLWVNNFLFKYDDNTKTCLDAVFVDFQNCFWGSCGFDINDFLNTSLQLKVLKENRQELIQGYYDSLYETLVQIKYPVNEIPSLQDVLSEIKRCEFIGLHSSVCKFPIVTMEKSISKGFNLNIFADPEKAKETRVLIYNNPRVQKTLKYSLKYFEEINIL